MFAEDFAIVSLELSNKHLDNMIFIVFLIEKIMGFADG